MITKNWVQKKINELHLQPSRGNGQNFLIEQQPLDAIVKSGDVQPGETVLEIGPGLGALTEDLLRIGAKVTAIEYDAKLALHLQKTLAYKHPLTIAQGDVLRIATDEFLANLGPYKLIANIPYHITSDIIRKFTECAHQPQVICLLIQKEVAHRLTATPPDMNQLAIFTQWFARIDYVETVSRTNFLPAPEVDSAIVRITPRSPQEQLHGLAPEQQRALFSFIKRGFSNPRKQLANNLSVKKDDPKTPKDFDFTRRAETLTIDEWITLFKTLA